MKTRMELNRELHNEVNRDIVYMKKLQDNNSLVSNILNQLKKIDYNYFDKKAKEFDKKNGFEKFYLERDRSKTILPDEYIYQIRKYINELEELDDEEPQILDEGVYFLNDSKNSVNLRSEKFIEYFDKLIANNDELSRLFQDIKSQMNRNPMLASTEIPMSKIQQWRAKDKRNPYEMLVESHKKSEESQNILIQNYRVFNKKGKSKFIIWFLSIAVLLLIVLIIIPIFI